MKSTMQYSVGGNIIDVADDRRDEFLADYQKDYGEGEEPEEVYTFWVNGDPVQVKASRVAEFLADCEADGVEARRTRNFVMDNGEQLRLDEIAAGNYVNAFRSGQTMSRSVRDNIGGIPERFANSQDERIALAKEMSEYFDDDLKFVGRGAARKSIYDDPKYDVPRNLGDVVTDAARPIVENPAVQGFAEGLKRSVTDPAELYRETYGDGVITSALLGAQDFANTAVKGGMDVVAKAAGGQDTEVGRAIREAESALPTDQADMGTDGSVTDTVLNFANDFSKNTLSTLMKYAAPGVAAVDIAGSVVDNYYDAYNKAIENGANEDKANALASASAGIGAAEGIWLAQSASGGVAQNAVKGALKRIFSMGGKMGTAAGARDIVEQGIEGAENPDLVRAGKEALKGAAEGAAFEATSMGVHGLADLGKGEKPKAEQKKPVVDEKARSEAKARYERMLPEETRFNLEREIDEQIKAGSVPESEREAVTLRVLQEAGENIRSLDNADVRENAILKAVGERGEAIAKAEAQKSKEAGADEAARKDEHDAREADIEAAFKEFTEEPVAKPDGKGKMVKEKPKSTISDDKQKAVREDATMQDIMARAKLAKTDAEKSALQDEFNNRWHQMFDKPAETEAPKMDYAEAVKTLGGMDAALPERELRKKMAQWEEHADDPRAAKMAEAARAVLERRASQGKTKYADEVKELDKKFRDSIDMLSNFKKMFEESSIKIVNKMSDEKLVETMNDKRFSELPDRDRNLVIEEAKKRGIVVSSKKPDGKGRMTKAKKYEPSSEQPKEGIYPDYRYEVQKAAEDSFGKKMFDEVVEDDNANPHPGGSILTLAQNIGGTSHFSNKGKVPSSKSMGEAVAEGWKKYGYKAWDHQDEIIEDAFARDNGRTKSSEDPTPEKSSAVATEPTDAGFKAWAVDSDGKTMEFASEAERAQSRKLFDDLVRSGAVDGKTGANIDAEAQVQAPTANPKDTAKVPDGKGKMVSDSEKHTSNVEVAAQSIADVVSKKEGWENSTSKDFVRSAERLVTAIENKDADTLRSIFNGLNKGSLNAFEKITGIKMPSTQKGQHEIVDKFCGITPEERVEIDAKRKADFEAKQEAERHERSLKEGKDIVYSQHIKTPDGDITTYDKLFKRGWKLVKGRRGAVIEGRIVSPDGNAYYRVPKGAYEYLESVFNEGAVQKEAPIEKGEKVATEDDISHLFGKRVPDGKGKMVAKDDDFSPENIKAIEDSAKEHASSFTMRMTQRQKANANKSLNAPVSAFGRNMKMSTFVEVAAKKGLNLSVEYAEKNGKPSAFSVVRMPDGSFVKLNETQLGYAQKVGLKNNEAEIESVRNKIAEKTTSIKRKSVLDAEEKDGVSVTENKDGTYDVDINGEKFKVEKSKNEGEYRIVDKNGDVVSVDEIDKDFGTDTFDVVHSLANSALKFTRGDESLISEHAERIVERKVSEYRSQIEDTVSREDIKAFDKISDGYKDALADYNYAKETGSEHVDAAEKEVKEYEFALKDFVRQAKTYYSLPRDKETGRPIMSPKPGTVEASILSDAEAERMLEREAGDNPTDAKKPLNAPPAPLPGSPGNAKLDPNYDPKGGYGSGVKDPIHRQQILDKVSELFNGKVAIRGKNTEGISRSAAGHFEPGASIIRSRDMGSLRTIPHEIGHFVHYLYDQGAVYKNGVKQPYPRDVARDLLKLGQKLYQNKQPNGGYQREGIAEIFKYYMQGNIDGLKAEAPKAYEWLTRDFAKEHPDVMAKVDEIRDMVDRYQNQSVEQEVRGAIRRYKNVVTKALRKTGEILKGAVNPDNWTQENLIDKFAFINKGIRASGMEDLLDWQGAMKRGDMAEASRIIENHPMMKAKLYNGKAGAKAFASMRDGLTSLDGTRRYTYKDAGITPPSGKKATDAIPTFKEIFADIPDARLDDWQDYALARIFKENYHAKGLKSGITPESIDKFLDLPQYKNNKIYEKALQDWTDYNHAVLHTLVDGGVMSQATYDRICKDNAIYTKVMRVMDDTGFFGRPSKTNGGKVVNKRKGSDRQVEDLFEATLVDHEKIIAAAMQGDLFRSIVELGERAEKIGTKGGKTVAPNWIHEVKNAKEAVKFSSEKIRDDFIGRAANELGSDDAAKDLYESMYGINGDKLTIFREKPSNGKNGIVSIYDQEGNLRTFELPEVNGEAWAKGLLGMNDSAKEGLFESYFKMATQTTKAGATMLNPTFAVRNMVRDTLHASVMNEYGKFVPGVGTAEGLAMDLLNTDTKRIYDDMCLGMGTFLGRTKMDRAERSVGYLRADNWFERELNKGITKAIADFVGFSENSTRLKEFKNVYDYMKSNGATDRAAKLLAGCNALDITVDFQRMGHGMQKANRMIPFVNAGVQGLEQFGRSMGLLRSEAWQLNQGSVFEKGKRAEGFKKMAKTAAKGALNLSSIAMAAAAYNLSDEERRRKWMELPAHEKWNYTSFGDVRIPVPFELGYAFMSVPTAIIAEMAFGDKGAVAECLATFAKSLPLAGGVRDMALIAPPYSVSTNRDWKDQEIVPQNKKDNLASVDWYGPKTTKAAIALGRALYKTGMFGEKSWACAPAYIDTLLDGYSGGMWSRIAKTCTGDVDWSMTRATDMPIIGTFFRRPNTSRVINDFYERSQLLTAKYNSPSIGISPEEYGEKVLCDEIKAELSPIFNENRGVMLSDMPSAERNRLVDENIKKAQDIVRGIEKGDLRRKGIARAANGLANEDASDAKIASDLSVLANVSESEAISAFRSYCNEWVYVTNKSGKRTGRRHRRMSDTETIQKRIRLIRNRMRNR